MVVIERKESGITPKSFRLNYWKNGVLLMMMEKVCDSIRFGVTGGI